MTEEAEEITRLLQRWRAGDQDARDRLWELAYPDLKRIARVHLRRESGRPEQTTALVHESFLRVAERRRLSWTDRNHFYAFASRSMRRILVDRARRDLAGKRRGVEVQLDELGDRVGPSGTELDRATLIALDRALVELEALDPRQVELVDLRFFGGFTVQETAEMLGMSARTCAREWNMVRSWLGRKLAGRHDEAARS